MMRILEKNIQRRFWSKVDKSTGPLGCWQWMASVVVGSFGYGRFKVESKMRRAHRLAFEMMYGAIPKGRVVMHKCDNPSCVNPLHLAVGTSRDNHLDAMRKKRKPNSTPLGAHHRKLNEADVKEIKQQRGVMTTIALGKKYGVDRATIRRILNGKTWKGVGDAG